MVRALEKEMVRGKGLARDRAAVMASEAARVRVVEKVPAVKGKEAVPAAVPAGEADPGKAAVRAAAAVPGPEAERREAPGRAAVLEKVKDQRRERGLVKKAAREAAAAAEKARAVEQAPGPAGREVVPVLMIPAVRRAKRQEQVRNT